MSRETSIVPASSASSPSFTTSLPMSRVSRKPQQATASHRRCQALCPPLIPSASSCTPGFSVSSLKSSPQMLNSHMRLQGLQVPAPLWRLLVSRGVLTLIITTQIYSPGSAAPFVVSCHFLCLELVLNQNLTAHLLYPRLLCAPCLSSRVMYMSDSRRCAINILFIFHNILCATTASYS
jgi:hypothetical protein